jgi:hypothetical protein
MNAEEQQQDDQLNAIGRELDELKYSGRLDFDAFKSLLTRAIAAVGPDHADLEMFCHFARGEGWWDWMVQEIQKAPSRHVA